MVFTVMEDDLLWWRRPLLWDKIHLNTSSISVAVIWNSAPFESTISTATRYLSNLFKELVAHSCSEKTLSSCWPKFSKTSALESTYGKAKVPWPCHLTFSTFTIKFLKNFKATAFVTNTSLFKYQNLKLTETVVQLPR